jgi:hypothetical protein
LKLATTVLFRIAHSLGKKPKEAHMEDMLPTFSVGAPTWQQYFLAIEVKNNGRDMPVEFDIFVRFEGRVIKADSLQLNTDQTTRVIVRSTQPLKNGCELEIVIGKYFKEMIQLPPKPVKMKK